jgi:hypothetical protein
MRPEPPDHTDYVFQQRIRFPEPRGLFQCLRKSKVIGTGEKLLRTIHGPRCGEFLGSQQAESDSQLVANEVLPSLTPAQRQVRGIRTIPSRDQRQKRCVLVVRVRTNHQNAPIFGELLK